MEKEKSNWGGRREGAGRKGFCEKSVPVCWRVSAEAREWIKTQAKEQGVPVGAIIDALVDDFLRACK